MLQQQDQEWLHQVIENITKKMDWVSEKSQTKIPYTTSNGIYDDRSATNPSGD